MYFEMYKGTDYQWRWRLRSGNHEIIAHGEAYKNKSDCQTAIELVKYSQYAPIYEV